MSSSLAQQVIVTPRTTVSGPQVLPLPAADSRSLLDIIPLPSPNPPTTQVQNKDRDIPDSHVPRDTRLIRLTGAHPFNAESPLTTLFDDGFLTSVDLFYVRNHGSVPWVMEDEIRSWELSVEGLVKNPFKIKLSELLSEFEQITIPVTLVCAGNRRKEQNTVRKSKGFSWGAAGLSTALFTGTLMGNLLQKARPLRAAKYVCMEGADELPNGHYGTSIKLNWALDPNKGILLAHGMNGAPLRADHGRPLRVVVPGQIGGRSVKWLRRLIVSPSPSDNWYHFYDNKVLPTTVTPEASAADPALWRDERYAIYDLNVNSAVVYPQHNETLDSSYRSPEYTVKGYAYSGGGRRVTRVEISLDSGRSWGLANVEYPEDKYRDVDLKLFGGRVDMAWRETCFCWCFWSHRIPLLELQNAESIIVRAMDESMMCQPRDMYWSVLGMMNNPWFRVAIRRSGSSVYFEHPTSLLPGRPGWMEKVKKAGGDLLNGRWGEKTSDSCNPPTPPSDGGIIMTDQTVDKIFSFEELRADSSKKKPLFVLNGEVYDGTRYLQDHPGGPESIQAVAGSDATDEFMAIHSENAKALMRDFHIGTLDELGRNQLNGSVAMGDLGPSRTRFLEPSHWAQAVLVEKKVLSWDTKLFIFQLDHKDQVVGLPVGQHLMLRAKNLDTAESVIRAYTPVSESLQKGTLELLVKLYLPREGRPGGKMSVALDRAPLGSLVDFKGPVGKFEYLGRGRASIKGAERNISSFVMICGGSGITPIFQVFRAVMQDPEDKTFCTVLDGNRSEEDILCKDDMERLFYRKDERCSVIHTLTAPPTRWPGRRGRISDALLREYAMPVSGGLVLLCGPPAMERLAQRILVELGWGGKDIVVF